MSEFTDLEMAVFAVICENRPDVGRQLHNLLLNARLSERENTGHGFFTSFDVVRSVPPVDLSDRIFDGPNGEIAVGNETLLIGFILWLEDGYPNCLEGFQYGTPAGEDIDLKAVDLTSLKWLRPML